MYICYRHAHICRHIYETWSTCKYDIHIHKILLVNCWLSHLPAKLQASCLLAPVSLFWGPLLTAWGWRGLWDTASLIRISCKCAHRGCIKGTLCCGQGVCISRLLLSLAECPRILVAPPYKWRVPSFVSGVGWTVVRVRLQMAAPL